MKINDFDYNLSKTALLKTDELSVEIKNLYSRIKKLESGSGGGGFPLGSIFCFAVEPNDPRFKKLDGNCILRDSENVAFYNYILKLASESPASLPLCTLQEYANEISAYGQCGKFVINETESNIRIDNEVIVGYSVKLPTITSFIASSNRGYGIGQNESDSLKSHRHFSFETADSKHQLTFGGALDSNVLNMGKILGARSWNQYAKLYGDIYTSYTGDAETRPKNVRYPYYIVVSEN